MSITEIYNRLVKEIPEQKGCIKAENFGLSYEEFEAIVTEIENDGLFKKGKWALGGGYVFLGLTFKGKAFLENNDKKEYYKIEKTEIHHNINVGGDNLGNIVTGNNNTITSEFEQKFNDLVNAINGLNLADKEEILSELYSKKNDKIELNRVLGKLLTRGAEVASITSTILALLGIINV